MNDQESKVGRRVRVDRATETYVPGGAEYQLVSADGEPVGLLPEGTVLEVVESPEQSRGEVNP